MSEFADGEGTPTTETPTSPPSDPGTSNGGWGTTPNDPGTSNGGLGTTPSDPGTSNGGWGTTTNDPFPGGGTINQDINPVADSAIQHIPGHLSTVSEQSLVPTSEEDYFTNVRYIDSASKSETPTDNPLSDEGHFPHLPSIDMGLTVESENVHVEEHVNDDHAHISNDSADVPHTEVQTETITPDINSHEHSAPDNHDHDTWVESVGTGTGNDHGHEL